MTRSWVLAAASWIFACGFTPDDPKTTLRVVSPKPSGIETSAINAKGEIIGLEWVEENGEANILVQRPFYRRGDKMIRIPVLDGYTSIFPNDLSDDGVVVGRVSRPFDPQRRVKFSNQAFVWDAKSGIRGLGAMPDDTSSYATGISRDGKRISGISVGLNRIRPCVWDRDGEGWKGTALPLNTMLKSNTVAISDDGRFVTSSDGGIPCVWQQDPQGAWTRQPIGDFGAMVPRAVNNLGTVVGTRYATDGSAHATIWTKAEGCRDIPKPKGFVRSEANAINNHGAIVGTVDGSHDSDLGPSAFVYESGVTRLLQEGGPNFSVATAINDEGQVAGTFEVPEVKEQPEPQKAQPKP